MSADIEIPPWARIAVNGKTAAQMMGCGRSTFFARVKEGIYPQHGPDGQWSVSALRAVHQASQPTTASAPDADPGTPLGYTPREPDPTPYEQAGAR